MPFMWAAGASVLGGLLGSDASSSAANTQANSAAAANQTQWNMFNTVNQQNAPWRQAGGTALDQLMMGIGGQPVSQAAAPATAAPAPAQTSPGGGAPAGYTLYTGAQNMQGIGGGTGPSMPPGAISGSDGQYYVPAGSGNMFGNAGAAPAAATKMGTMPVASATPSSGSGIGAGQFTHMFNTSDLNSQLAPNYAFQLQQGQDAAKNMANASGGMLGGNALQGLEKYTQDYAGGAYQNAFNNYQTGQSNIFNRLSNIAGLGQQANQTSAGNAATFGTNIGNNITSAGAAQAAGQVGSANAITGGINNAASWYGMNNLLGNSGGGGGNASYLNTPTLPLSAFQK